MTYELKVPSVGESVTEGMVAEWLKKEGDRVETDEPVVVLDTDKASVELPAPGPGILVQILKKAGEIVHVDEVIGVIDDSGDGQDKPEPKKPEPASKKPDTAEKKPEPASKKPDAAEKKPEPASKESESVEPEVVEEEEHADTPRVMPAARVALKTLGVDASQVRPTGPGGRILKEDVIRAAEEARESPAATAPESADKTAQSSQASPAAGDRPEEIVPMTPIRKRIAERLVAARRDMALLTTFNEIDMGAWMDLRRRRQDSFQARHGVKLGMMSIFVKAVVDALKNVPQINAEIRDDSIVFKGYYDIGVAVSGGKGLVVPVLRDADRLGFAAIEKAIEDFGARARSNRLDLSEMQGGTFTISNGGVFGSLLSTPIVNPPQSGVLGLHAIQDRPVARDGQVVIRPMMYVALTYDHRIVDGREAVTFLKRVKDLVEDPALLMLDA
jgi:2-oxoglutarate dehydrogenase E2 component (dihydrolipoamide succinyltransferase)